MLIRHWIPLKFIKQVVEAWSSLAPAIMFLFLGVRALDFDTNVWYR